MTRPFRFGTQVHGFPAQDWAARARHIEALGFSSVLVPDHFRGQWEPVAFQAAAAAVTEHLRVGTLVYGIDYRHPVVLAMAGATVQLLSGGRCEFGLGAGWMESDYVEAGIEYDRAGLRIEKLDEALQIAKAMWSGQTSFEGKHYTIREIAGAVDPLPETPPAILVGGGGPKLLAVAGRHADIVGINPKVAAGKVTAAAMLDGSAEKTAEKVRWVREAAEEAGRDFDSIEINALVFATAIVDDPSGIRAALSQNSGMTVEDVARCPLYLTGSPSEVRDTLEQRREDFGFSYVVMQGDDPAALESFAEHVIEPLAGK
jgi:probable F420-dependent oxidoreductase